MDEDMYKGVPPNLVNFAEFLNDPETEEKIYENPELLEKIEEEFENLKKEASDEIKKLELEIESNDRRVAILKSLISFYENGNITPENNSTGSADNGMESADNGTGSTDNVTESDNITESEMSQN